MRAVTRGLICFVTVGGSMGDVRPLIALALAIRARGFDVLFLADRAFERDALRAGVRPSEWVALSDVPQTFILRTESGQRRIWEQRQRWRDRWMHEELRRHRKARIDAFWQRIGGPDSRSVIAAIGGIPTFEMLLRFGPHCAKIVSSPWPLQPSKHFTLARPRPTLRERLYEWKFRRDFEARHEERFCGELFHLVSASPAIFPRPEDWPPNMQVTGYITLDEDFAGWTPSAPLRAFLDNGAPPVYVGFGSYPFLCGARGERLAREIVEGCRARDVRCILHSPDLSPSFASDRVFVLDQHVPYDWLLPRCAVIVHHGGYGTVHTSLAAQRPMVIYPFQTDQFFWAVRAGELGVGPGFTARLREITAQRLACDLACVMTGKARARAEQLGAALRTEQALPLQVAAIESIIEHTRDGGQPSEWRMPVPACA